MARPRLEGLEYFPHETNAVSDEKIEYLRSNFGNDGYAFYFIMLERIYAQSEGMLKLDDMMRTMLVKKVGVPTKKFDQMLGTSLKIGLFDNNIYESERVIISKGIKKRVEKINTDRVRKQKKYASKFGTDDILLNTPSSENQDTIEESGGINGEIFGEIPGETLGEMTQSKEKKSKEKKSKEKKSKEKKSKEKNNDKHGMLSLEEIAGLREDMIRAHKSYRLPHWENIEKLLSTEEHPIVSLVKYNFPDEENFWAIHKDIMSLIPQNGLNNVLGALYVMRDYKDGEFSLQYLLSILKNHDNNHMRLQ